MGTKLLDGVFTPSFNARPGQNLPIIMAGPSVDERKMILAHWGIVTEWSGFSGKSPTLINTRFESFDKPFFKHLVEKNRCLIVVDGFYEWRKEGKISQPYLFTVEGFSNADEPLCLAGIYSYKVDDGIQFSLVTVPANEVMIPIHDRMPVVMDSVGGNKWLTSGEIDSLNDNLICEKVLSKLK